MMEKLILTHLELLTSSQMDKAFWEAVSVAVRRLGQWDVY